MIVPGIGDVEFDWFGIDQNGNLGAFSTSNVDTLPRSSNSLDLNTLNYLLKLKTYLLGSKHK